MKMCRASEELNPALLLSRLHLDQNNAHGKHDFGSVQERTGIKRPLRRIERPLQHSIQKNLKDPQNSFKRTLLRHFVWEIAKAPATNITLPLWPVHHSGQFEVMLPLVPDSKSVCALLSKRKTKASFRPGSYCDQYRITYEYKSFNFNFFFSNGVFLLFYSSLVE
jgi:hypothetical protein